MTGAGTPGGMADGVLDTTTLGDARGNTHGDAREVTDERLMAQMEPLRAAGYMVIDLTHRLLPSEEQYRLEVKERGHRTETTGDVQSEVFLWSHVGTHAEAARHFYRDGGDTSDLSLDHFIGPALRVDLRHKQTNEAITVDDFKRASEAAGGIREGDRVFMWQGREGLYRTPHSHDRPYVSEEAAEWLVLDRKIKVLGTDSSGFEVRGERASAYPLHTLFFRAGKEVPMIECMRNLGAIPQDRFFFIGMPLPVKDLDASPIRAVALVPSDGAAKGTLGELLGI
jgi:arylformamidase